MAYYSGPGQYAPPPPPPPAQYHHSLDNTDTVAMILEIVFGLFGLMGMGWLYAGSILTSALIFIGFTLFLLVESGLIAITGGLCACLAVPANIGIAVFSAFQVRDYVRRSGARGSVLRVVIAGVIGFLVVTALVVGLILLIVSLGLAGSIAVGDFT